jgi:hypothetical protein
MSKIHVLGQSNNVIDCVAHFAMSAGNNTAGVPWKTAYLATFGTGAPTSILPTSGNNNPAPGKIGNAELSQIVSGDLIEITFQAGLEAADLASQAATDAKLNIFADRAIAKKQTEFAETYKYYGYTVA